MFMALYTGCKAQRRIALLCFDPLLPVLRASCVLCSMSKASYRTLDPLCLFLVERLTPYEVRTLLGLSGMDLEAERCRQTSYSKCTAACANAGGLAPSSHRDIA